MRKCKLSDYYPIVIMIIIVAFISGVVSLFTTDEPTKSYDLETEFGDEYKIIMAAAARNHCEGDNRLILFAIRKAENGRPGLEFGVINDTANDLDSQAGWAAATIVKNRKRWEEQKGFEELFGDKGFIIFLGRRYCPPNASIEGHANWVRNVIYWFERFRDEE